MSSSAFYPRKRIESRSIGGLYMASIRLMKIENRLDHLVRLLYIPNWADVAAWYHRHPSPGRRLVITLIPVPPNDSSGNTLIRAFACEAVLCKMVSC